MRLKRTQQQTAPPFCSKEQSNPEKLAFPFWKKNSGARKSGMQRQFFWGAAIPLQRVATAGLASLVGIVFKESSNFVQ